jgi:hypothetical protein
MRWTGGFQAGGDDAENTNTQIADLLESFDEQIRAIVERRVGAIAEERVGAIVEERVGAIAQERVGALLGEYNVLLTLKVNEHLAHASNQLDRRSERVVEEMMEKKDGIFQWMKEQRDGLQQTTDLEDAAQTAAFEAQRVAREEQRKALQEGLAE